MRPDITPGGAFPDYELPEHDPMIPHTIVLKPGLVLHRVWNKTSAAPSAR